MARHTPYIITNEADLNAYESTIDLALCGVDLAYEHETRYAQQGAHDPTPTHYFILEELFKHCPLDKNTHLLDVGCSTGRVLAYYLRAGHPGQATGVELDPELAAIAQAWTARYPNLHVLQGNALDLDLSAYTIFYLFNPFSPGMLQRFIESIELQVSGTCTVIHTSDNGDTWHYVGRPGWTEVASGAIEHFRNARGYRVKVFDHPQHYTVWRYDGSA